MAKKSILRGLARLIVVVIIAICAWCLPPSYKGWVTGFLIKEGYFNKEYLEERV